MLYDFERLDGSVDDNVFASSNRFNGQRSLVVYHNRYAETAGRIRISVAVPGHGGSEAVRHGLSAGLELSSEPASFVIFRDAIAGLEYIRPCGDLSDQGLELQLKAYELHVFMDFREVVDDDSLRYRTIADRLAGRGVESVADEVAEIEFASVLEPLRELVRRPPLPPGGPTQALSWERGLQHPRQRRRRRRSDPREKTRTAEHVEACVPWTSWSPVATSGPQA